MKFVTAADIDDWTSREPRKAQEMLPLLIWKLILASCHSIIDHHFPFGKAIQYSGYDGALETEEESPFFPKGKSVWELGTNENVLEKFNDDYGKRLKDPNGVFQAETTFCFVTTRIWKHKKSIVDVTREKDNENIWKKVRIYDATTLELWLEQCPAVNRWLSGIMGFPMDGVQDLMSFWEEMKNETEPALEPAYFLHNRMETIDSVLSKFCSPSTSVVVSGDSWIEIVLCIAAYAAIAEDIQIKSISERCVIVDNIDEINSIIKKSPETIIIPKYYILKELPTHLECNYLIPVIRYSPLDNIHKSNKIVLPQRSRKDFCESLQELGYNVGEANDVAQLFICNFPAFLRHIMKDSYKRVPGWSNNDSIELYIPLMFAGGWEEEGYEDKSIIAELAKMPYDEYKARLIGLDVEDDTPFLILDSSFYCVAIQETWDVLLEKITQDGIDKFISVFKIVFSSDDPKYELPEEQWHYAPILGKQNAFSHQLKEGLITSMIMLVERIENLHRCGLPEGIRSKCDSTIASIFESSNSLNHWRSICPYIPMLYEASPESVIQVLEKEAANPLSCTWELFKTSEDPLFGRSFYTNLLRTLECAVWDKRFCRRAYNLLILYAEHDFEYKISNSPLETLYNIFCLWHPVGAFSIEQRKILLRDIAEKHKKIAPELITRLLEHGGYTMGIAEPRWKRIDERPRVETKEYAEMYQYLSGLYIDYIFPCYKEWSPVIKNIESFGDISFIIQKCLAQKALFSKEDRVALCGDMLQYISHARLYKKDENDTADLMEELYYSFQPHCSDIYALYFKNHFRGLNPIPFSDESYDYRIEEKNLFDFRCEKMREMIQEYGNESIIDILPMIENISSYAETIVEVVLNRTADWDYILNVKGISETLAESIVARIYYKYGLKALNVTTDILSFENIGWAYSCVHLNVEITEQIKIINNDLCSRVYWERVNLVLFGPENNEWTNECIQNLLKYNRPFSLIRILAYSKWNDPRTIIEILNSALTIQPKAEVTGLTLENVGSDAIQNMFIKLYENPQGLEDKIAWLEALYLRAFLFNFEPRCLMDQILRDPRLYFELLTIAYKSDDGSLLVEKPNDNVVMQAIHILDRIHRIPGYHIDSKTIDEDSFDFWISSTYEMANSNHYSEAHDIVLGKILSYSPPGTDGIWPAECVRRVFERQHSKTLEVNFIIERENQRGVYTGTAGEGEEMIAKRYDRDAEALEFYYPKTASIIQKIGDRYHAQSHAERIMELKGF